MSRLDDFDISLVSESPAVSVYARGNCIAAVGAVPGAAVGTVRGTAPEAGSGTNSGTNQGATGLMTEQGLAYLVWRDGLPFLAAKGSETPATPEEVETIRNFSRDLSNALESQ